MAIPPAGSSVTIFEDLDGDGDLDLFLSGNGVSIQEFTHIYLNDGTGVFTQLANPALPVFSDSGVDIEDVDGDGDADLLIAVEDEDGVFIADVFLNDGNAIFTPSGNTGIIPVKFGAFAFIDIENDGDADVIISGEQEDESAFTALYLNDGTGNFSMDASANLVPLNANDVDVADIDNDGDLDILMSGSTDSFGVKTILYINDGTGQFTELPTANLQQTFAGTNAIADMDNDGDQDLLIIGSQAGGLPNIFNIVYENLGINEFLAVDTLGGEYIAACVVDDFNGDALVDVIIQGFVEKTNVYWNTSVLSSVEDGLTEVPLLSMFPNPSSGQLSISLEEEIPGLHLSIYAIDGRLVFEQANLSGTRTDLQFDLRAGSYTVLLRSENRMTARRLVVVN